MHLGARRDGPVARRRADSSSWWERQVQEVEASTRLWPFFSHVPPTLTAHFLPAPGRSEPVAHDKSPLLPIAMRLLSNCHGAHHRICASPMQADLILRCISRSRCCGPAPTHSSSPIFPIYLLDPPPSPALFSFSFLSYPLTHFLLHFCSSISSAPPCEPLCIPHRGPTQ